MVEAKILELEVVVEDILMLFLAEVDDGEPVVVVGGSGCGFLVGGKLFVGGSERCL